MKILIAALFIYCLLIIGCTGTAKDETKEFIPGTYIRSAEHEFGAEHDTIVFTLQIPSANEFKIERRWKYARVLDGKPIEPEYKQTSVSAVYNAETKLLQETQTAETYTFDPKQKAMFAGTTKYQKLK